MARRASANEDPESLSGSVTEKKRIIAEVAREVLALEAERKGVGEKISAARGRLKSAGILQADFNAALRLFKLEGDERGDSLTAIQVCFEALGIGGQGTLFPDAPAATKPAEAKQPVATEVKGRGRGGKPSAKPKDFKAQKEEANRAGRAAARAGKTLDACKYEEEPLRIEWVTGFDAERDTMEEEQRGDGAEGKSKPAVGEEQQPAVH